MWGKTPNVVALTQGSAEGRTSLNAFDNALLAAGIGDLNLIQVSSVYPAGAELAEVPDIPPASLVPVVYSYHESTVPGEMVSACVGVGRRDGDFGLLFEYSHKGPAVIAEEVVTRMIEEGFQQRGVSDFEVELVSTEHRVDRIGCAVAAAVMWWG